MSNRNSHTREGQSLLRSLRPAGTKIVTHGTRVLGGDCSFVDLSNGELTSCTYHLDEDYEILRVTTSHLVGNIAESVDHGANVLYQKAKKFANMDYTTKVKRHSIGNEMAICPIAAIQEVYAWPDGKTQFALSERVCDNLSKKGLLDGLVLIISTTDVRKQTHRVCIRVHNSVEFAEGLLFLRYYSREAVKHRHLLSVIGCIEQGRHGVTACDLVESQAYEEHFNYTLEGKEFSHGDHTEGQEQYVIVRSNTGTVSVLEYDETEEAWTEVANNPMDRSSSIRVPVLNMPKATDRMPIDNNASAKQDRGFNMPQATHTTPIDRHAGAEQEVATRTSPDVQTPAAPAPAAVSDDDVLDASASSLHKALPVSIRLHHEDANFQVQQILNEMGDSQEKMKADRILQMQALRQRTEQKPLSWEQKALMFQQIGKRSQDRMKQRQEAFARQKEELRLQTERMAAVRAASPPKVLPASLGDTGKSQPESTLSFGQSKIRSPTQPQNKTSFEPSKAKFPGSWF